MPTETFVKAIKGKVIFTAQIILSKQLQICFEQPFYALQNVTVKSLDFVTISNLWSSQIRLPSSSYSCDNICKRLYLSLILKCFISLYMHLMGAFAPQTLHNVPSFHTLYSFSPHFVSSEINKLIDLTQLMSL